MAEQTPPQTVLMVETDRDIRLAVRDLLEVEGYTVLEATRPDEALATLVAKPDCVVLIFSNSAPQDHEALAFFSDIAADPDLASRHAYLYLTTTPHHMLPALVRVLAALEAPIVTKPFEIIPLVETVAAAAQQRC